MVAIKIRGKEAFVDKLVWTSEDPRVSTVLNNMFTEVMGVDPYPDLTAATLAIERIGGEIISADSQPSFVEGRIY